jgi:hypothetical protein
MGDDTNDQSRDLRGSANGSNGGDESGSNGASRKVRVFIDRAPPVSRFGLDDPSRSPERDPFSTNDFGSNDDFSASPDFSNANVDEDPPRDRVGPAPEHAFRAADMGGTFDETRPTLPHDATRRSKSMHRAGSPTMAREPAFTVPALGEMRWMPPVLVGGAFVLGLAAGRFLRATTPDPFPGT